MASTYLACPNCGNYDRIYSVETMIIEYPVNLVTKDGVVTFDYTGDESKPFDDTAENRDGSLHCRNCDHEWQMPA